MQGIHKARKIECSPHLLCVHKSLLNLVTISSNKWRHEKYVTQQTWLFSSGAGEGDLFDSTGLSAPQFCLLHLVLKG